MKLIVGLGNPGSEYENTRHNCGFIAIDALAKKHNLEFRLEPKFKGMIAKGDINGEKVILLKPMTYMNLSGEAVRPVMTFYKIELEDVLIICDDLDSPTARIRLRAKGSAGGHNGLKSIIAHVGSEEFKRIKIGIDRSPNYSVVEWVLKKFSNDDLALINQSNDKVIEAAEGFIKGIDFNKLSSTYSTK